MNRPGGPQAARWRSNQAIGLGGPALLVSGQGHDEPAEHEGALGVFEGTLILAEAVDVAGAPRSPYRFEGGQAARDRGRKGPRIGGQQQGGIDPLRHRGPAAIARSGADSRADVGQDRIGQRGPYRRLRPRRGAGNGPQSGHADEPGVCPAVVVELPEPGVRLAPALFDDVDGGLGGLPVVEVEVVVTGGGREEQERLTYHVELELMVDPVAHLVGARRGSRRDGRACARREPGHR